MSTIVLTGGGTAGHIIPNLALLDELRQYFDNIHYIGGEGMEKEMVSKENIPFHSTKNIKFDRMKWSKNLQIPIVIGQGTMEAKKLLTSINPDIIFSKGGFVSLPTCFAAKMKKIPIVIHESDYTLGLANKVVAPFAQKVLTSFPETEKGKFVGNPIRDIITKGNKENIIADLDINPNKKTILIFGGSLGSEAINNTIYKGIKELCYKYNVVHISGKSGDFQIHNKNYNQLNFVDNIQDYYNLCDCVISRAGANSLAEIASLGLHSIAIPLPSGNSRGDQLDNAKSYQNRGFSDILLQEELFVESLIYKIDNIWDKPTKKLDCKNINKSIVDEIIDTLKS
ncbi:MAG: UDP-N-acetylglucosamine--N-acetylmuramyl-(pentapeptide) pyrophosphoryl-undecaprenol N-acetylglucosamine transferase [Clostridia bacterium]